MAGEDKKELMKGVKIDKGYFVKRVIAIALLIAPAMLVAPPLLIVPLLLFIPPLFAFTCILDERLKDNEKAAVGQRFGDVLIGIISGLVASYLMWVLLTFGEISIFLLFLFFPMLVASLVVAFSLIVVWVSFTTKRSR